MWVAELSSPLPRPHAERRGRTSGPRAASLPDRGAIQPAGAQTRASCAPEPETTGPRPAENKEQPTREEALRAAPLEGRLRAGGAGLTPPRPVAGPGAGQQDGTLPSQESGTSESKSPSPGPGKSLSPTVHQFGVLGAVEKVNAVCACVGGYRRVQLGFKGTPITQQRGELATARGMRV